MTEEQLYAHIAYRLCEDPADIPIKSFVESFYPNDIQVGRTLANLFNR